MTQLTVTPCAGFVKGVTQGIVGVAANPISGALDFMSSAFEGMDASSAALLKRARAAEAQRARLPRAIAGDRRLLAFQRPDGSGMLSDKQVAPAHEHRSSTQAYGCICKWYDKDYCALLHLPAEGSICRLHAASQLGSLLLRITKLHHQSHANACPSLPLPRSACAPAALAVSV